MEDPSFTTTVREQDRCVEEIHAMAAGIAMALPRSYQEAISGEHGNECKREIDMLEKMGVWDQVALPKDQRTVSSKWVFSNKLNTEGEITRRKSRLVV